MSESIHPLCDQLLARGRIAEKDGDFALMDLCGLAIMEIGRLHSELTYRDAIEEREARGEFDD